MKKNKNESIDKIYFRKNLLKLFLPIMCSIILLAFYIYKIQINSEYRIFYEKISQQLKTKETIISESLQIVTSDLLILANSDDTRNLFSNRLIGGIIGKFIQMIPEISFQIDS